MIEQSPLQNQETWVPVGSTLRGRFQLDSLLDTSEGFRAIVRPRADLAIAYVLRTKAVFYQLHRACNEGILDDSWPSTSNCQAALFEVSQSVLLKRFMRTPHFDKYARGSLTHFALLLDFASRLDIITMSPLRVRLAGTETFD